MTETHEYWRNETNKNANSGSEMMMKELEKFVDPELLKDFHFTLTRERDLPKDKIRIYWAHDLPNDPESIKALAGGTWQKYHKIVFVSNWQQQQFIEHFGIDWSRTAVLRNAIVTKPLNEIVLFNKWNMDDKPIEKLNLIYHTTPHRGLEILIPVLEKLKNDGFDNWHLDVFSSFAIYGWNERDRDYQHLYDKIENNERMTYHGFSKNEKVREYLDKAHIFTYPNIWTETSCRSLIEAMNSEVVCLHPNFGALPETSGYYTDMYDFHENVSKHAEIFYDKLKDLFIEFKEPVTLKRKVDLVCMQEFSSNQYAWRKRKLEWENLLDKLKKEVKELDFPKTIRPTGKHKFFRYEYNG